jgi:hypothetical protein
MTLITLFQLPFYFFIGGLNRNIVFGVFYFLNTLNEECSL